MTTLAGYCELSKDRNVFTLHIENIPNQKDGATEIASFFYGFIGACGVLEQWARTAFNTPDNLETMRKEILKTLQVLEENVYHEPPTKDFKGFHS